jgi:trypsin-like peptidase
MWRLIARFAVAGAFVIFTTITLLGQTSSYSESVVTIYTTTADGRIKQGSGFVADGGIVTAYHVVHGGKTIEIVTSNNQVTTDVTVLAYDPASDIALVSAQFRSPIRPLSLLVCDCSNDMRLIESFAILLRSFARRQIALISIRRLVRGLSGRWGV